MLVHKYLSNLPVFAVLLALSVFGGI